MSTIDEFAALLRVLGADLEMELEFNASGACGLRIDDSIDITLRYELCPPGLLMYASVGALRDVPIEGLLRNLLEANHLWDKSRGSTWSLTGNEVILSRFLPLPGLEGATLSTALAEFVEVALAGQLSLPGLPLAHAGALAPETIAS